MKEHYGTTNAQILLYNVYGGFVYFNVMGNIWKIMTTNTSTIGKILPTLLKPGNLGCSLEGGGVMDKRPIQVVRCTTYLNDF
jgi:hypothetical protein